MYYYEILVASPKYHGNKPLTYSSDSALSIGSVVVIPLQRHTALGVVAAEVAKPGFTAKHITRALSSEIAIPKQLVTLVGWLRQYYPAPMGQAASLILPSTLRQQSRKKTEDTIDIAPAKKLPPLTAEQKHVVDSIINSHERMHLLHGDTGTGKTRVYLELVKGALEDQRSAIILTPEIGLTPQLAQAVEGAFPGRVVIMHSGLTPAQRRDRWVGISSSAVPIVVIGPRSALFSPLKDIGLIVLDEAHDNSYKQEQAPHYQASRVAAKLAELHKAKVILGSATPLISDYFTFTEKNLPIHRMVELAVKNAYSSNTVIVNLRDQASFIRSNWLSTQLLQSIEKTISSGGQALIFLNRRGSARLVLCQQCGWQAVCPRCDVPLTYHGDTHRMLCHTCGFNSQAPVSCPSCSSTEITFKSIGTKAIASELERLFPKANIRRFDSDNIKSERLEAQYEAVHSGDADIIIGTQLLSKGLDLPNLGLVGIVVADSGLYFPDYTAEERTFQLINQVIGRAGRGHKAAEIIVQTYNPDNRTLQQALNKDYNSFYNNQINERRAFKFPPFRFMLKLQVERASSSAAQKTAEAVWEMVRNSGLKLELSAPAPAFVEKIHNRYRWQIIARAVNRSQLLRIVEQLPANVSFDIDPVDLL